MVFGCDDPRPRCPQPETKRWLAKIAGGKTRGRGVKRGKRKISEGGGLFLALTACCPLSRTTEVGGVVTVAIHPRQARSWLSSTSVARLWSNLISTMHLVGTRARAAPGGVSVGLLEHRCARPSRLLWSSGDEHASGVG